MATGRTVGKFFKFVIGDSADVIRDIPVNTIGGVGLTYDQVDQTALQDALKGFLTGQPDASVQIGGPFSNAAAQAASGTGNIAALSGSHTVLYPLNGLQVPRSLGIYAGIQAYWATGDPCFGITKAAGNGILVFEYKVDFAAMTYTAMIKPYPGSALVDWATTAFS